MSGTHAYPPARTREPAGGGQRQTEDDRRALTEDEEFFEILQLVTPELSEHLKQ